MDADHSPQRSLGARTQPSSSPTAQAPPAGETSEWVGESLSSKLCFTEQKYSTLGEKQRASGVSPAVDPEAYTGPAAGALGR